MGWMPKTNKSGWRVLPDSGIGITLGSRMEKAVVVFDRKIVIKSLIVLNIIERPLPRGFFIKMLVKFL